MKKNTLVLTLIAASLIASTTSFAGQAPVKYDDEVKNISWIVYTKVEDGDNWRFEKKRYDLSKSGRNDIENIFVDDALATHSIMNTVADVYAGVAYGPEVTVTKEMLSGMSRKIQYVCGFKTEHCSSVIVAMWDILNIKRKQQAGEKVTVADFKYLKPAKLSQEDLKTRYGDDEVFYSHQFKSLAKALVGTTKLTGPYSEAKCGLKDENCNFVKSEVARTKLNIDRLLHNKNAQKTIDDSFYKTPGIKAKIYDVANYGITLCANDQVKDTKVCSEIRIESLDLFIGE